MSLFEKLLIFVCFNISVAIADNDIENSNLKWLQKMNNAMKTLNYQGTVAFMKNGRLDTMKYIHAANNGFEQERLLSLNSPLREVVRDSGKVSCTFIKTRKRVVNHHPLSQSFIIDLPKKISSLASSYKVIERGEESVAMRPSQVIEIHPNDKYRYARKIWLDKQFFLPLKIEVYKRNGATIEQVVFTDIGVEDLIPFKKMTDGQGTLEIQHLHKTQPESLDKVPFFLGNLPAGFTKVLFTHKTMHPSEKGVDHLLLSDGLSSISVYVAEKGGGIDIGLQTLGSVNSFSRSIGKYHVVVLGEVPAKTVEFIAKGIRFSK